MEATIRSEIEQGLFHRALPFLIERGRYGEAGELERRRGHPDQAAKLFERARDYLSAGRVYEGALRRCSS